MLRSRGTKWVMSSTPFPTVTLGDRLRRARLDANLGSDEMAELLALGRTTISNWESGRNKPSPRKIRRIAEIVAERTDYEVEGLLVFLDAKPITDTSIERRRNERRTQQKRKFAWIDRASTHTHRAEILTLVERRQPEPARRLAS